jgi:pyruvate/2-oxoglutarate dehydrogenase complex dihydrolipoamide acyltransferase (E2) component
MMCDAWCDAWKSQIFLDRQKTSSGFRQHHSSTHHIIAMYRLKALPTRLFARQLSTALPQIPIPLPKLSPTMRGGRIVKWLVREGDHVDVDQVLFELETDTLTEEGGRNRMLIEAQEEGIIAKIFVNESSVSGPKSALDPNADTTPVNAVIAVLSDSDDVNAAKAIAAEADERWGARVPTSPRFNPGMVGPFMATPHAMGSKRQGGFCWQAYVVQPEGQKSAGADACMK